MSSCEIAWSEEAKGNAIRKFSVHTSSARRFPAHMPPDEQVALTTNRNRYAATCNTRCTLI